MKVLSFLLLALVTTSSFAGTDIFSNGSMTMKEIYSQGYKIAVIVQQSPGIIIEADSEWTDVNQLCKLNLKPSRKKRIVANGRKFELKDSKVVNDGRDTSFTTSDKSIKQLYVRTLSSELYTLDELREKCGGLSFQLENDELEQASLIDSTHFENNV